MRKLTTMMLIMASIATNAQYKITANNTAMTIRGFVDTNFVQTSNNYSYGAWGSNIRFVGFGSQTYTFAASDIDSVNGVTTKSANTTRLIAILDSITSLPAATGGTYTPTISKTLNMSTTTARKLTYMRVGNTITVSGQCDLAATAAGTATVSFTLPVASDFATAYQAGGGGTGLTGTGSFPVWIQANATTNLIEMSYLAPSSASITIAFTFTYEVI